MIRTVLCLLVLVAAIVVLTLGLGSCATTCPPERAAARYGGVLECVRDMRTTNGCYWEEGHTCTVLTSAGARRVFVRGCR